MEWILAGGWRAQLALPFGYYGFGFIELCRFHCVYLKQLLFESLIIVEPPKRLCRFSLRTHFDGLACAVLVSSVEDVAEVRFTEPWLVQHHRLTCRKAQSYRTCRGTLTRRCGSTTTRASIRREKFEGKFDPAAKIAARVVLDYYENPWLNEKFSGLVDAADQIDSARLSEDEVLNPQGYYALRLARRARLCRRVVQLLRRRLMTSCGKSHSSKCFPTRRCAGVRQELSY